MLDHLKQRIVDTLAATRSATLATSGPADLQANVFPCEAADGVLFALVPRTSDHLLNIENHPAVVVSTEGWQMRGAAEILATCPPELALGKREDAPWCSVVRIAPERLHIAPGGGVPYYETIDII
jgi:hypothetical protein